MSHPLDLRNAEEIFADGRYPACSTPADAIAMNGQGYRWFRADAWMRGMPSRGPTGASGW